MEFSFNNRRVWVKDDALTGVEEINNNRVRLHLVGGRSIDVFKGYDEMKAEILRELAESHA